MKFKTSNLLFILLPVLSMGFSSCAGATIDKNTTVIRVLNWEDYIYEQDVAEGYNDPDLVIQFEDYINNDPVLSAKYGRVKVIYETTDTNETMFNEIQTGKSHYDLICPSDYMIQKLISKGHLEKMNRNLLPNYQKYVSEYMKDCLDNISAKNEITKQDEYLSDYTAGYMWGTLGLVFNPEYSIFQKRGLTTDEVVEDMSTYASLWNEKYNRTISVKDSMRDTYAIGVLQVHEEELKTHREDYLAGKISDKEYNKIVSDIMNNIEKDTISEVTHVLSSLKNNVFGLEVDSGKQDIVTGKIGINFAWSGDAVYSIDQASDPEQVSEVFDLYYSVPELGSNIWFDGWVIPKNEHRSDTQYKLAHEFIDFLSNPLNAAQNVNYIGYTSFVGGDAMLELYRDWYDNRTDLIYHYDGEECLPLYYKDPNSFEIIEVSYDDCHFESENDPLFDDVEIYYLVDEDNKVVVGTYNNDLLISEEWEKVDLTYFFNGTFDEYSLLNGDQYFYSDNYLPFTNSDGSKNVSVGGAFFCQLPDIETMTRCAVMRDFGESNDEILQMWENFKSDPLPGWAVILFSIEIGGLLVFLACIFFGKAIKLRLRKKRKGNN